mgnify:CR=1 FL=1
MTVKKKTRLTSYNFWVRIVSAVVLILRIILSKFGINIDSAFILDIATLVAGFLVVVGIINEPTGITISYKNESGDDMVNTENIKTKIDEKLKEVEKIFAGFGIKDKAVVAESLQKIDDFLVTILQNELKDIEKMQNELDGKTDEAENEETEKSGSVGAESEISELNEKMEGCEIGVGEAVTENVGTEETESTKTENENTKAEEHESVGAVGDETEKEKSEASGETEKPECENAEVEEAESENAETDTVQLETIEIENEKSERGVAENKINDEVEKAENDEFKETEVGVSEAETSGEMGKSEVEASENGINEKPEIGVAEIEMSDEVEETDSEIIENEETDADTLTASEIAETNLQEVKVGAESDEKIVDNHNTNQQENTNLQDTDRQQGVDVQDANRQEINLQDANGQDVDEDADRQQDVIDQSTDPQQVVIGADTNCQQGVIVQSTDLQQDVIGADADQSRQVVDVNFADPQGVSQSENGQSAIELIKNLQDEFCGGDQTKRGEFCDRLLNILENNLDSLV